VPAKSVFTLAGTFVSLDRARIKKMDLQDVETEKFLKNLWHFCKNGVTFYLEIGEKKST